MVYKTLENKLNILEIKNHKQQIENKLENSLSYLDSKPLPPYSFSFFNRKTNITNSSLLSVVFK
jgi:hypothetical protein